MTVGNGNLKTASIFNETVIGQPRVVAAPMCLAIGKQNRADISGLMAVGVNFIQPFLNQIKMPMRTISIQFGLVMLAGFIAIFYIIYMLGYAQHTELRVFNAVVHLSCMYLAIKAYYKTDTENVQNYMLGVAQGMEASVIGVVGYALFIAIFMKVDPQLMNLIKQNSPMAIYLNPYTITLGILTEGLMVSLIGSYILTRIYGYTLKAV